MIERAGRPKLGTSATTLGVRLGKDIEVDPMGMVHRPSFASDGKNGISCAPSLKDLPPFVLPLRWGGMNRRTIVWRIESDQLSDDLVAMQDGPTHISIGPARSMPYDDFVAAVQSTASLWVQVV